MLPNGLATGHSCMYLCATADVALFRANKKWHEEQLRKYKDEPFCQIVVRKLKNMQIHGCADGKGYIGVKREIRAIISTRKPLNEWFSVSEGEHNQNIFSDRVIVEN